MLWAVAWERLERVGGDAYRVTSPDGPDGERSYLARVVRPVFARCGEWQLVVEGLFVRARPGRSLQSVLELAESAGELLGELRPRAVGEVLRPRASDWRPRVLGIGAWTRAEEAEAAAIRAVGMGLVTGLGALGVVGHACEAACLARWGISERVVGRVR